MEIIKEFEQKAKENPKRIVLPEGSEPRVLQAAHWLLAGGITRELYLLGDPQEINQSAGKQGLDIKKANIINPSDSDKFSAYTEIFYDMRKHKGLTREQAREQMSQPIFYGAMMMAQDEVDGNVAGCITATADVLRAAISIVKPDPQLKSVSSFFLMIHPDTSFGENGVFFFADCAVNPQPDAESLAAIALATAQNAEKLLPIEARVAMLSFSTLGSAEHPDIDKVRQALAIARDKNPNLKIDGEIQADAAIIPEIGQRKAPASSIAGKANVLIFPDLDAANISYKFAERLGNMKAIGPILQGLNKPCNDLSRGASAEDIYNTVIITSLQSG